jgi:tol-pal system protein YbgF
MAIRRTILAAALALAPLSGPAAAQDGTLADIRQELSVLFVELQRLKRELSTTGNPAMALGGTTALERMDRIEAELQRLIGRAEEMELRIERVVSDGTNRVGDLEFRLCELEPDCDISSLGDTPRLGGDTPGEGAAITPAPLPPVEIPNGTPAPELAMGEQADFDAAREALDNGDHRGAADRFLRFTETYPGGPLNGEAHFLRGEALEALGETAAAARAYLAAFSGNPDGARAPDALLRLGIALGTLGQRDEACVMLAQVGVRYPGSVQEQQAQAQSQGLGCP